MSGDIQTLYEALDVADRCDPWSGALEEIERLKQIDLEDDDRAADAITLHEITVMLNVARDEDPLTAIRELLAVLDEYGHGPYYNTHSQSSTSGICNCRIARWIRK